MNKITKKVLLGLFVIALLSFGLFPVFAESVVPPDSATVQGFGETVTINQPEYWTDFMPPGWQPPVIKMTLQVFNFSSIPVRLDFNTSQRYDFMIYNSRGVEVWRWSAGKMFLMVLGSITLNPGQVVTYTADCKFVDIYGNAMPVDLYTLRGVLTATDRQLGIPRVIEGKVSFWHHYVY